MLDTTPYTDEMTTWLTHVHDNILSKCTWGTGEYGDVKIVSQDGLFGTEFGLDIDGVTWATSTPVEILARRWCYDQAEDSLLITGLGLGVGVMLAQENPKVKKLTVLENNRNVINLVMPMLSRFQNFELIELDANEYVPFANMYTSVYVDHILAEPEEKMYRKYLDCAPLVTNWYEQVVEIERQLCP